ncbi:MAG: response regulator transcription factor [Anaerolineales bacterium]
MAKTILLIDDEIQLLSLLSDVLTKEGYRVISARNGQEAIYSARQGKPDLIILDIMMPEMDGYEFIRQHRRERDTPIILLTAKVEEEEKVLGLRMGADDYITKPFSPRELVARIEALLRRSKSGLEKTRNLRVAGLLLDFQSRRVAVDEKPVELTRSEFDLLAVLMASPGRVFSREELLEKMQGGYVQGYERTIDVHIKNLRAKIEADPHNPRYIETVYGVGYRLASAYPD